ncbi:hypothetical protein DM02DRAFT_361598 [Periconia macrospinosa]|uniref:Protein kinase domain-containing protein n=1 Tax=Periconia macrospinosa TaxID=97972 RepID=A0A2V1DVH7_9PLEO|nr:hypothetical protein DM02DRAFT_361598 [Periconia macrospinosa]
MEKRETILRWLTRDSPSHIEHIQIIQQTISGAQAVERVSNQILHPEATVPDSQTTLQMTNEARDEAQRLTRALTDLLTIPETTHFAELDVSQMVKSISERTEQLLEFLTDCLATTSDEDSLKSLRRSNLDGTQDLANRIAMRITLIQDQVAQDMTRVYFDQLAPANQHLWIGRQGAEPVLVEYWNYEASTPEEVQKNLQQAARISALLSEVKGGKFRILPGLGHMHESNRHRIGFVYKLPGKFSQNDYVKLSDLMGKVKSVPLDLRTRLASTICDFTLHLHSIGWFHKAIKSANILIFRNLDAQVPDDRDYRAWNIEDPYLIGFDCSRPSEAETWSAVDFSTQANIYRHPERWGAPKRFEKHHDLYALVSRT